MTPPIELLFGPKDYEARPPASFAGSACVMFDVLRATSVMLTGLANGAQGFIPVAEIAEALALRTKYPQALLAGERGGLRISAAQSGGTDFNFGNSPREFTRERVRNQLLISTTTNGTRALRACASAPSVAIASFLNLTATAQWLNRLSPERVILVCAGTAEHPALEDILCAGALCDLLNPAALDDAAEVARLAYRQAQGDVLAAVRRSLNGSRLLAQVDLQADVEFCLQRDLYSFAAAMGADGIVRKIED